jgi:hypothetical protein
MKNIPLKGQNTGTYEGSKVFLKGRKPGLFVDFDKYGSRSRTAK